MNAPHGGPQPSGQSPANVRTPTMASAPRTLDSQALFGGQTTLFIRHLGELYRLQITRQGKLILTK